jgi:hypothetical protein
LAHSWARSGREFIDNSVWKSRQGPEVGPGEEKTGCCLAVAEGWGGLLAGGIDQLDVPERRKCLFKKELRGLKSVVLASWQSHQWGSTEPTETFPSGIL